MSPTELARQMSRTPGRPSFWAPRFEMKVCFHCGAHIGKHAGKDQKCPEVLEPKP